MADYGLTDAGFVIPTFDDILDRYVTALQNTFGSDVATSEDTVFGQLFRIVAYTDYTLWEGMQGVYNSQTLNGAEGTYLDDLFAKRGLTRQSATAGSGFVYVKSTSKALWTASLDTDTYFTADNDLSYYVSSKTLLNASIAAYTLTKAQATSAADQVTFYIQNTLDGGLNSITLTSSSNTFMSDLVTFIQANVASVDKSLVSTKDGVLYVGFNTADYTNPVGLSTATKFYATVSIGTKWSLIPVAASEKGYNPVSTGGITGISSTFTGYSATGNFTAFSTGTDVETDAEFRSRFNDNQDEANAATRPAIISALLNVPGVTKVRVYDNPTSVDQNYAPAFTFNTIVYGGDAETVARTIYEKKPINTLTYGTVATTITTEDGGSEIIKFTPGSTREYSVKLVYTTASGKVLTTTEKANITTALRDLEAYFEIGSKVTNDQMKGVIYNALDFGRLTYLAVYVKLSSEDDGSYNNGDIEPAYSVVPSFDTSNISYEYKD